MFYKHIMLFSLCGTVYHSTFLKNSVSVIAEQEMQNPIIIQLIAQPLEFSLKERTNFKIGMEATNVGNKVIEPKLYESVLLVDGEPNLAWNLAINNGLRGEPWWNLKPGETVKEFWPLGKALFPKPGEYNLLLRYGSQESSVRIRVTP